MTITYRQEISRIQDWERSKQTGKLPPCAHVVVARFTLENGEVIGQRNHRCAAVIQPDGTWKFEPEPVLPDGFDPIPVAERALVFQEMEAQAVRCGLMDHLLPDGSLVTYAKGGDGTYARTVTPPQ